MKKLRLILSFTLLIEARSFAPKIIKISAVLLKPVPGFFKSIHAWIPATAGVVTTHALSGATTEVMSELGNQMVVNAKENFNYTFYTGRQRAQSFDISGLPNELDLKENIGSGTITGFVSLPGTYLIKITGYHFPNQSGSSTPPFTLTLTVKDNTSENDSDGNGSDNEPDSDKTINASFSEITELSNNWYQSWWGTFYIHKNRNWVFHSHLGWLYAHPSAQDTFWLYDKDLGWLYTSKTLDRYFYRNSTGGWLYKLDSTSDNRFWDYQENSEVQ